MFNIRFIVKHVGLVVCLLDVIELFFVRCYGSGATGENR